MDSNSPALKDVTKLIKGMFSFDVDQRPTTILVVRELWRVKLAIKKEDDDLGLKVDYTRQSREHQQLIDQAAAAGGRFSGA